MQKKTRNEIEYFNCGVDSIACTKYKRNDK